jgi:hypothetical protein
MKHSIAKFLSLTLTGLGILVVAATLDTVKPGTAIAGDKGPSGVVVVNDAMQPVPIAAQGTTNVAGTVAVSSMPPVTLSAGGTVSVANTPSTPVFVRDVNNPALQPFGVSVQIVSADGAPFAFENVATVPSNKTLVVEDVSFTVRLPIGQKPFVECLIGGSVAFSKNFEATTTGFTSGGLETFAGGRPVKFYVPALSSLDCGFDRSDTASHGLANFVVNGHYVDTP